MSGQEAVVLATLISFPLGFILAFSVKKKVKPTYYRPELWSHIWKVDTKKVKR